MKILHNKNSINYINVKNSPLLSVASTARMAVCSCGYFWINSYTYIWIFWIIMYFRFSWFFNINMKQTLLRLVPHWECFIYITCIFSFSNASRQKVTDEELTIPHYCTIFLDYLIFIWMWLTTPNVFWRFWKRIDCFSCTILFRLIDLRIIIADSFEVLTLFECLKVQKWRDR